MSTVLLMTSLLVEDCSRFLPPQHRTLDHRLFEDVSVAQQDPPMTQNANVVDLVDRRHGACRLSLRYVGARPLRHRNASTASLKDIRCGARSQCSRWSRGMIWSYQLALNTIVLLHSSPTATPLTAPCKSVFGPLSSVFRSAHAPLMRSAHMLCPAGASITCLKAARFKALDSHILQKT